MMVLEVNGRALIGDLLHHQGKDGGRQGGGDDADVSVHQLPAKAVHACRSQYQTEKDAIAKRRT